MALLKKITVVVMIKISSNTDYESEIRIDNGEA